MSKDKLVQSARPVSDCQTRRVDRPSRLPLYLGVVLLASAWAVIGVAWWQAGRQDLETGQLPYVISGGFGGFGLLLMGVIGILIDVVRQAEWKLRRSAEQLHDRLESLAEAFVAQRAPQRRTGVVAQADASGAPRPRRRRRRRRPGAPAKADEQTG